MLYSFQGILYSIRTRERIQDLPFKTEVSNHLYYLTPLRHHFLLYQSTFGRKEANISVKDKIYQSFNRSEFATLINNFPAY